MAAYVIQYHHYIPRFILRQFAYTDVLTRSSTRDGLLHVFDLSSGQFQLRDVSKTCGAQNLYYNAHDTDPMRIEHLFSKLESKTSVIFSKIKTAVAEGRDHVDILEKDVHILFKFMHLSLKRSEQYRDEIKNPYRENDFLFQELFDASKKSGRSGDPAQWWLEQLLYLLETSHEDILARAEKNENGTAATYKHFIESYALQVWKAADGYEYFLNDRLVDFEGDTQSCLGVDTRETGPQLMWMTTEDWKHLVLPISPEVAIIFCNESRCWESPFADMMHRLKIPYPENSLLKNAPHKDITNIDVPREKRGRKTWPATVAWRVSIGTLSRDHHRILASYSLGHAKSFVVFQCRRRFERARREIEAFSKERTEVWKSQGIRFSQQDTRTERERNKGRDTAPGPSQERMEKIADEHMSSLSEVLNIINTTQEPLPRTKENAFKSWLAFRAVEILQMERPAAPSSKSDAKPSRIAGIHPALKSAFESAYPPKHPDHRDLITIDFGHFFAYGIGEESFAQLTFQIESKISELVCADTFHTHWEAVASDSKSKPRPPDGTLLQSGGDGKDLREEGTPADGEADWRGNPALRSVFRAAQGFDVLKWMFEERQDILATFVQTIAVPMDVGQPQVVRIRGRRE